MTTAVRDRREAMQRAATETARQFVAAELAGQIASPYGLYVNPQMRVAVEGAIAVLVDTRPLLRELGAVPGGSLNSWWPAGTPYRCGRCGRGFEPERWAQVFCGVACRDAAYFNEPLEERGHTGEETTMPDLTREEAAQLVRDPKLKKLQRDAIENVAWAVQNLIETIEKNCPPTADRTAAIRTAREANFWAGEAIKRKGAI